MSSKSLQLADDLSLPIEAVTEKLAWLGRTGSGKTYGAMKLAELMLEAGAQVGVIDPVGVWRALRVPASRGGRAFDVVVFGGLSGDLPLEPTAGALVADIVAERHLSFVLDVSQFIPSELQRFSKDFAARFFQRRKAAPAAIHLFLEECQEFIPQNPIGKEAETLGAFNRLWKLGRNFGIGGSLISQRPQEISKKALNMSGTLFAFQMTGPQERKAIRTWVADQGVAIDIEAVLQKLERGRPHVESPTFLATSRTVAILPRVTADLSSTPEVHGPKTAAKRALTPIDVEQLTAAMQDTIERAKADDPRELRKQIAQASRDAAVSARRIRELEARLERTSGSSFSNEKAKQEAPLLTDADRALITQLGQEFATFSEDIGAKADAMLESIAARAKDAIDDAVKGWTDHIDRRREAFAARLEKARVQRALGRLEEFSETLSTNARSENNPNKIARSTPDRNSPLGTGQIGRQPRSSPAAGPDAARQELGTSGAYRMLVALAEHSPDTVTLSKLALRTGISRRGGTFRTYLGKLKSLGWVHGNGTGVAVTDNGLDALGEYEPMPTGDALIAYWQRELGESGARRMFDAIVAAYPKALTAAELEAATGIAARGGTFRTYLGKLRTLDLVTRGEIRASEELFS